MRVWAVYEVESGDLIVWPLHSCRTGEYAPVEVGDMPLIRPLPISVHRTHAAAIRARARLLYACAGTA